jgi:hypothetical protein
MTTYSGSDTSRARSELRRLHLSRHLVYSCRFCREAVRVLSAAYLPEECPTCAASTWEEGAHCGSWAGCEGVRRPGLRSRAHCQVCGYSVWTLVGDRP